MHTDQKLRIVKRGDTITVFNPCSGETIIDGDGNCNTPFLLDVSLTNKCNKACSYCYKQSHSNGYDMSFSDFRILISKMKEVGVFQVAYGGGNPNEHPDFIKILKETREAGIVPNYSTNGEGMSARIIRASKKYCGAVAVSFHDDPNCYKRIIRKLIKAGIKTNIHFIMKKDKIDEICNFLNNPPYWARKINAIILLRYKPVAKNNIHLDISDYRRLFECVKSSSLSIGFDACSYFLIKKLLGNIDSRLYDFCQGARSSAYVNERLIMTPCSFDKHFDINNDLHFKSIVEIFNRSESFIRRKLEINKCKVCLQFFKNDLLV